MRMKETDKQGHFRCMKCTHEWYVSPKPNTQWSVQQCPSCFSLYVQWMNYEDFAVNI